MRVAEVSLLSLALAVAACGSRPAPSAAPHAASAVHTSGETQIALTEQAARRLDLQVAPAATATQTTARIFAGELVAPPGRTFTLTAPVAGTVHLSAASQRVAPGASLAAGAELLQLRPFAPADRDVRAQASRLVALAQARVDVAQLRMRRTEAMLQGQAGSQRAVEEARGELASSEAELRAARQRSATLGRDSMSSDVQLTVRAPVAAVVRAVHVASGQAVAAGAPVAELVDATARWVRVPVHVAETALFDRATRFAAEIPGSTDRVELEHIPGPPTADFAAGTSDRWFTLRAERPWPPGTRLEVHLRADGEARPSVPLSALLFDATGGAAVYVERSPLHFVRRSVLVAELDGASATLSAGLAAGTRVVTAGAAELAGFEAPGGH